jgi:hypothetical protein
MILYEMLTGTAPFQLDGSLASLLKRAHSPVPAPRIRNADVTPQVEAVIVKALAASKSDRYATGKELAAALSSTLRAIDRQDATIVATRAARPTAAVETKTFQTAPTLVAPAGPTHKIPLSAWAATAAIVVAIVTVLAATMWRRGEPQTKNVSSDSGAAIAAPAAPAPVHSAGGSASPATLTNAEPPRQAAASTPAAARREPAPAPEVVTAKQLYDAPTGGETGKPGLKLRIVEQRGAGEADADPSKVFHSGDRVRFAFESNIDGYLYVVQAGSSGRWTVLFPNPDANGGRNAIVRSEAYLVPDNGWFAFDDTPGTEEVFVVVSKQPLDTLPGFNAPVTRRETVDRAIVTGLQAGIRPRDLLFEKDQSMAADGKAHQVTYIVNRSELANQVAALIQLTHAK